MTHSFSNKKVLHFIPQICKFMFCKTILECNKSLHSRHIKGIETFIHLKTYPSNIYILKIKKKDKKIWN